MSAVHEHNAQCPSRLRFDRLIAGELPPEQAQQLEQHASRCARCQPLLAEMKRGYEAFDAVVPNAVVQRVRERSSRGRAWLRASAPLLAAASVLLVWAAWPAREVGTRSKGGPKLAFYVLHDGAVRPGTDGERVQPGDHIEFAYASAHDAYLAIVSIDAARKASVYYAKDGRAAPLRAANRAVLEQSTLLDETLGPETVYALVCAQPIAVAPLLEALERAPERAPVAEGCSVERYALLKVPR
jgi:anti-sigma factor RsiW